MLAWILDLFPQTALQSYRSFAKTFSKNEIKSSIQLSHTKIKYQIFIHLDKLNLISGANVVSSYTCFSNTDALYMLEDYLKYRFVKPGAWTLPIMKYIFQANVLFMFSHL